MSIANGKVCCNCRHCIRQRDNDDHEGMCHTYCDIDKHPVLPFAQMDTIPDDIRQGTRGSDLQETAEMVQ